MKDVQKREAVVKKLINKQLEPHGKTFEDVENEPEWYSKYTTTPGKEKEFITWGIEVLRKDLGWSKNRSEREMSWFILNYGLKTLREL